MLCDLCREIKLGLGVDLEAVSLLPSNWRTGGVGVPGNASYHHHKSCIDLQQSAKAGCSVCGFFVEELLRQAELQDTAAFPSGALYLSSKTYVLEKTPYIVLNIDGSTLNAWFEPFLMPDTPPLCNASSPVASDIPGRYSSHDPGSETSFAWIKASLYDCCTSTSAHLQCAKTLAVTSVLPHRILDLNGSSEEDDLHLTLNEKESRLGKYVALSHCWGQGPKPLQTTTINLSEHLRQISFASLPRSFQDAVRICRRLKVQYLWIDTLCILQDSTSDWAQEASSMATVYQDAYFTLAFSGAANSHQGVLAPRAPLPSVRLGGQLSHIFLRGETDVNLERACKAVMPPRSERYKYRRDFNSVTCENAPLGHRGWAYQETLLSSRVLFFTSCQLAWKCTAGAFLASTILPQNDNWRWDISPRLDELKHLSDFEQFMYHYDRISDWKKMIGQYSDRNLTVASDKLVAFSGIARRFAALLNDDYVAGLWRNDLAALLMWRALVKPDSGDRHARPKAYRAPSWSWAAIDGSIKYIPGLHKVDDRSLKVISFTIESATTDIFGEIKNAQLRVHGFCIQGVKVLVGDLMFNEGQMTLPHSPLGAPEDGWKPQCYLDILAEFGPGKLYPPETAFTLLRIRESLGTTSVLMLKEAETGSGVFHRVGFVEVRQEIDERVEWVECDLVLI